jgi:hypothetical protein
VFSDSRTFALLSSPLTRTAPARASAAHVSEIGHITATELAHHLSNLEAANGFLNRFCFIAARRHRLLPDGGSPDPLAGTGLEGRLRANLDVARRAGEVRLDPVARAEWRTIYAHLSEAQDGIVGSLCARAEAHVLRLAMLYALTDGATTIGVEHLRAGLALWEYSARSTAWGVRTATADPIANQIQAALVASTDGLTRTQLRDLFGRNLSGARIEAALSALGAAGTARCHRATTTGRPAEIWTAELKPALSH